MAARIEDYALVGDRETAGLVCRDGSIDWLCFPRFDSPACFAALLGTPQHGRWQLHPAQKVQAIRRRYQEGTLVLETEFQIDSGVATLLDFMPTRQPHPNLVRIVEGQRGEVAWDLELILRFDYGSVVPWVRRVEGGIRAIAGPDSVRFRSDVELKNENFTTTARFTVRPGQRVAFTLLWHPSYLPMPDVGDPWEALKQTTAEWQEWSGRCTYQGPWREVVLRSLITLEALTYAPTGGIVAAATTSLPEHLGGVRNWDYRYCWLRDATFTLYALLENGYHDEAQAWGAWLLRAVAGRPDCTQILYGLAGERRLPEFELDWLPGYENSRPVRVGNAASRQFQLDVYGEVLDSLYQTSRAGLEPDENSWRLAQALLGFLGTVCMKPDEGIWEVRGPRRQFTHSKVMVWVALDRGIRSIEEFGLEGPIDHWRTLREQLHAQICVRGFNTRLGSFVQSYGSDQLDASLLMIPLVGFLPPSDPRVQGTVQAIGQHLMHDGFVRRYDTTTADDGLPPGEGAFLACTFWYIDNLALLGRHEEARRLYERMLGLCNDVGLLAEEYDPQVKRQVGNFPQAFSHVGLINSALNLSPRRTAPAKERGTGSPDRERVPTVCRRAPGSRAAGTALP
jgi:GH15 family glucan-1,4-alpha-glucosidase